MMARNYLFWTALFLLGTAISCRDNEKKRPDTALETGRTFIRATLDGDFKTASPLLLNDAANNQLFEAFKTYYGNMSDEKKTDLKNSLYQINSYMDVNDSVTLMNYSSEHLSKPMDIKIIRKQGNWYVDYKYTYSGNLPID